LFSGHFKALTAPDALNPVTADMPTGGPQQSGDPPVAIAPIFGRQGNNRFRQRIFVSASCGDIPLRSPWLADDPAGVAFR